MMRFKNGLALFQRTSAKRTVNIASFHSPHSLTWTWILSFNFLERGSGEHKVWPLYAVSKHSKQWMLRVPFVGYFMWHRQEPMWYRDLFAKARDREDDMASELRKAARIVDRLGRPKLVQPERDDTFH